MSKAFEHGGNVHQEYRNNRSAGPLLDFSANINPLGLAPTVRQAILSNLEYIIHYPDPAGYALKQALAKFYGLPYAKIVLGNGAVELLYSLCHTIRPRRVLIPAPTFSEYERAARSAEALIDYYCLERSADFRLLAADFSEKLAAYDMVFIGNPNNPTGTLLTQAELLLIVQAAAKANTFVVVDESFLDFIVDSASYSAKSFLTQYDNLLILHSLTKFYAIPGLRLGFAATSQALAERLHLAKDPWNVNSLAQAAGLAALEATDYQRQSRQLVRQEQAVWANAAANLPQIKFYRPSVNFILADLTGLRLTAAMLQEKLKQVGILIRNCDNYPGLNEYYVRFAIKDDAANQALLAALNNIVGEIS